MQRRPATFSAFIILAFILSSPVLAQSSPTPPADSGDSTFIAADYPKNRAGVLIQDAQWSDVAAQTPSRSRVAHGIAASLSYGAVPAKIVSEYPGQHSSTAVAETQPVICICHFISLPGAPVLVRLHPKKDSRELDGGRMTVYPIVGGSKMADANKSDLILADISHPEPQVWLVRPQAPLDPGEYALMLGTQNMSIFPFTVTAAPPSPNR
jgi:hypothetical protein